MRNAVATERARHGLAVVLLTGLVLGVFGRAVTFEFLYYDDSYYVWQNELVRGGLTPAGVWEAFTTIQFANWHPVTMLSYMADVSVAGVDSGWFHGVNVSLHLLNVLLLYGLVWVWTGRFGLSVAVAALWGVHPLHVEPVAWISGRKDLLSTAFLLGTLLAYTRYAARVSPARYAVVALLLTLGLLSKSMLVTAPFVLLLIDYWRLNRTWDRATLVRCVVEKIPLLLVCVVVGSATYAVQQSSGAVRTLDESPLYTRAGQSIVAYAMYHVKTVWPTGLAALYPTPAEGFSRGAVVLSALVMAGLSCAIILGRRRAPWAFVGWLWFVGMLAPVSGIVTIGGQYMADRYTYAPHIGLFVGIALLGHEGGKRLRVPRAAMGVGAAILVGACATTSAWYLSFWRNDIALFERSNAISGPSAVAYTNIANRQLADGRTLDAIGNYRAALLAAPNRASLHNNMGIAFEQQGDIARALGYFERAVALAPEHVGYASNRARLEELTVSAAERLAMARAAHEERPGHSAVHEAYGDALAAAGRLSEAQEIYALLAERHDSMPKFREKLGLVLARQGRYEEAIPHLQYVRDQRPNDGSVHYNLALAHFQLGAFDAALAATADAQRASPGLVEARVLEERIRRSR